MVGSGKETRKILKALNSRAGGDIPRSEYSCSVLSLQEKKCNKLENVYKHVACPCMSDMVC